MSETSQETCPVCRSEKYTCAELPYSVFRHLDFATVGSCMSVAHCDSCQAIFRTNIESSEVAESGQCASEEYAQSHQTAQLVRVAEFAEPVTRSFLQAEILAPLIVEHEKPRVLDIGCHDGALLREVGQRLPNADLHGFDINPHLKVFFEGEEAQKLHFYCTSLADIEPSFDLISISYALMLIPDLANLFEEFERLLAPNGTLYLQTSNIERNPCYILMGDHHHYYSAESLANLLRYFGFEPQAADTDWFPREAAFHAKRSSVKQTIVTDSSLETCLQKLATIAENVRSVSTDGQLAVLGTTGNAAFVDSLLGDRLALFVDENRDENKMRFRGKEVLLPSDLKPEDTLLLPYGDANKSLIARFTAQGLQNVVAV